jgi:hypothetical protein
MRDEEERRRGRRRKRKERVDVQDGENLTSLERGGRSWGVGP